MVIAQLDVSNPSGGPVYSNRTPPKSFFVFGLRGIATSTPVKMSPTSQPGGWAMLLRAAPPKTNKIEVARGCVFPL